MAACPIGNTGKFLTSDEPQPLSDARLAFLILETYKPLD
jgi:hypothetical protein